MVAGWRDTVEDIVGSLTLSISAVDPDAFDNVAFL